MNIELACRRKFNFGAKKYEGKKINDPKRNWKKEAIEELIDAINYLVFEVIGRKYSKAELSPLMESKLHKMILRKELAKKRGHIYSIQRLINNLSK